MDIKKKSESIYITTTLPYVNAEPHVGFAMELIRADVLARYFTKKGNAVFFNTGTDEHGQKLFTAAEEAGKDVQEYVDHYAQAFKDLPQKLGILDSIHFVRTTDAHHEIAAQEFWKRCFTNGYIYKKNYQVKYCVGCELEKTESELVDGRCPIHPNREIELIDEENYFFKFSAFQKPLLDFYAQNQQFVIPDFRFNEIKAFVERGLEDFSISRLKSKMSWGIPVPGDPDHVMYVWFDALVNYISTLGWPENQENFDTFWKEGYTIQYCGKDNLRQQSAMWQAMLMAAGLPNTKKIIINGFLTAGQGIKMSKSLGNVIHPYDVVSEYGTDALRYFLTREVSSFEDSPFTMERFKEAYNAGLANGLGNLVSRIMKMAESNLDSFERVDGAGFPKYQQFDSQIENFNIQAATEYIWGAIKILDQEIQHKEPFKLIKVDKEEGIKVIRSMVSSLLSIAEMLDPILPKTAKRIQTLIKDNKSPETPLFQRKD